MGPQDSNVYSTPQGQGSIPGQGVGTPANSAIDDLITQRQQLAAKQSVLDQTARKPIEAGASLPQSAIPISGAPIHNSPLIEKQTVGAKSTRDKGIANTLIGAMNLIGQVSNAANEKKQQQTSADTTRILQAQDSINTAQQTLTQDPNNKDAQAVLKANKNMIDMMDPKRLKMVAKALDINFVDPSKNNTPEHKAGQAGIKSYSDQLQAQLPQKLGPNQAAIAAADANREQVKTMDSLIKSVIPPTIRAETSSANTDKRIAATAENTDKKIAADADKQTKKQEFEWSNDRKKAAESFNKAFQVAALREHGALAVAALHEQGENTRFDKKLQTSLDASGGDFDKMSNKDLSALLKDTTTALAKAPSQSANYAKLRDGYASNKDTRGVENTDHLLAGHESETRSLQAIQDKIQGILTKRMSPNGKSTAAAASSGGASSEPVSVPAKHSDDSSDNPDQFH